jgi:hypothetical protein
MSKNRRLARLIALAAAAAAAVAALGFPAPSLASQLDLMPSGRGRIVSTISDARPEENAEVVCSGDRHVCTAGYIAGRVVTLRAEPDLTAGPSSFRAWSDDRCPPAPVCKITLEDDRQSVVASFSPQLVAVNVFNTSGASLRVTSSPAGVSCEVMTQKGVCRGEFPLFSSVDLIAQGDAPRWRGCDTIIGAKCSVTAHWARDVFLEVGPFGQHYDPLTVELTFHVAKEGTGSGSVRSESLDCGNRCSNRLDFGTKQAFIANAAPGSRFVGWRGACSSDPRCTLVVGPVTRLTAVFDDPSVHPSSPPSSKPSSPPSSKPPTSGPNRPNPATRPSTPSPQHGFFATVDRRVVVRGVRPRRIRFTVRVNQPSSIRAALQNGRGNRVASRAWNVKPGRHLLRLSVPRRAQRGSYLLRITARDQHGHVKQIARRIRLRR